MKRIWYRLLNEPVYLYGTLNTVLIVLVGQPGRPDWLVWAAAIVTALLAREVRSTVSPVELENAEYRVTTETS